MKFRELDITRYDPDTRMACHAIRLLKDAREVSQGTRGSDDFQRRCNDAIFAIANRILTNIELAYKPETKKFKVKYSVERAGVHEIEVEAESKEDALEKADEVIANMPEQELQGLETEFTGTDIISSEEVK